MTFPEAAEAARGGRAQQHMVGRRVFELENPSTIDQPSTQTTPHFVCTPSLRPMPPLTLGAHVPCGQRYEAADGQMRTTSTAQGHVQPSWGRGSSRGPCMVVVAVVAFVAANELFYELRSANLVLGPF